VVKKAGDYCFLRLAQDPFFFDKGNFNHMQFTGDDFQGQNVCSICLMPNSALGTMRWEFQPAQWTTLQKAIQADRGGPAGGFPQAERKEAFEREPAMMIAHRCCTIGTLVRYTPEDKAVARKLLPDILSITHDQRFEHGH
jgi:hypothetical protein